MNQGGTADRLHLQSNVLYSSLTESIFLSRAFSVLTPLTVISQRSFSFLQEVDTMLLTKRWRPLGRRTIMKLKEKDRKPKPT